MRLHQRRLRQETRDIALKTIDLRLAGVREATRRSRFVFIVMTIAAGTILVSLWNSILAWDRSMAFKRSGNDLIEANQKILTSEWLERLNISVGLFGIHVSAADLAVVGSGALIIIMVWFFFSQRRENRAVVGLLRYCREQAEAKRFDKALTHLVYGDIVQSILFIDLGGGDEPISLVPNTAKPRRNKMIRGILKGLVFLPPLTILAIIISDCATLFMQSFARDSLEPLWKELWANRWQHKADIAKIVGFEFFAVVSCV